MPNRVHVLAATSPLTEIAYITIASETEQHRIKMRVFNRKISFISDFLWHQSHIAVPYNLLDLSLGNNCETNFSSAEKEIAKEVKQAKHTLCHARLDDERSISPAMADLSLSRARRSLGRLGRSLALVSSLAHFSRICFLFCFCFFCFFFLFDNIAAS